MSLRSSAVIVLASSVQALGGVFSYECDTTPEAAGWEIVQIVCEPDLWVGPCEGEASPDDWCFFQHVELCEGYPPPGGQEGTYTRTLDEFIGEDTFFVEWVVHSTADRSEIPWGGGAALAVGNDYGICYTFFIAADQAELNRDVHLPAVFVDFDSTIAHTHRLELYNVDGPCGDQCYIWYIDGEIVAEGIPEGAFPSFNPDIVWRAKAAWEGNTTTWQYIRHGLIPVDGSGDYDSDGDVDGDDYYYFAECIERSAPDEPAFAGCAWADMDGDGDVDCDDWVIFAAAWFGTGELHLEPGPEECHDGVINVDGDDGNSVNREIDIAHQHDGSFSDRRNQLKEIGD
jgi:hypothetical protein